MAHYAMATKPIFDSNIIFLAITTLENVLEEADCFENIMYSDIQENLTVKRRVLHQDSLRSDWFKVLQSGEVLVTLLHVSDKVRSVLAKYGCPLQPVLEGNEYSNWQRLRTLFLCNWQSLYSVVEYLQQYCNVRCNGLDSSGQVIVDCPDVETARILVLGALTQCFILLGKHPLMCISGDHPRHSGGHQPQEKTLQLPQQQQQHQNLHQNQHEPSQEPHEHCQLPAAQKQLQAPAQIQQLQPGGDDRNNNAGNASKNATLQPKVNRLSSKKRVICIYDTTTSEGSDQASIDATPIDNRNSIEAAQQQQQQQAQPQAQQHQSKQQHSKQSQPKQQQAQMQPQPQLHLHQAHQHQLPQNQQQATQQTLQHQAGEPSAVDIATNDSLLDRVLRQLDDVKALLLSGGPVCQVCRQRGVLQDLGAVTVASAAAAAAAAAADAAAAAAAETTANASASGVADADEGESDSASTSSAELFPKSVADKRASVAPPLPVAAPTEPVGGPTAKVSGRKRLQRRLMSKRVAVSANKFVSKARQIDSGTPRRHQSAKSTDADAEGSAGLAGNPDNDPAPVARRAAKLVRTKLVVRRRTGVTKSSKQSQQPLQTDQQDQYLTSGGVQQQLTSGNAVQKTSESVVARHRRAESGDHLKKQQQQQQQPQQQQHSSVTGTGVKPHRRRSKGPQDAARSLKTSAAAAAAAAASVAAGASGGANANNDGGARPTITKSTVQDLITKLQAVINEHV